MAPSDHHVYVPTPGDHYSPMTGSAIMTLVYEFTRQHIAAGGRSQIVVGKNTRHDYPAGEHVTVDFRGLPDAKQKVVDVALGLLGQPRYFINRSYAPAVDAVAPDFDGTIFVQNTPGPICQFKRRRPRARVCMNVHNELFRTYGQAELHRVMDQADLIICNCDFLANRLRERMRRDLEKLRVVHNGVDTERFVPCPELVSRDEVSILFVARMVPDKGADLLVKAAAHLHAAGKRFKLRIVGNRGFSATDPLSPYEIMLRKIAAPMGDAVEFLPFMDRHKILPVYQAASIFCAPSNYDEPCTLTVPEAMACGAPVVASRRGGIPEIGGDAVVYFDPPDHYELADRLADLIDSEALRQEWSQRARARALEVDWTVQYRAQQKALASPNGVRESLPFDIHAPAHFAHMTMPLSRGGSAITNVVRCLVLAHPGRSSVITSHNRDVEVIGADNIRADFTGASPREYFDRFEMAVDHVFGFLNRDRPFTGQLPLTAVQSLRELHPDAVFVHEGHYASSALPLFRRWLPKSRLFLYVHTRLSRSYTRRELRRLLSKVDGIVCVSGFIEKMVRERLGRWGRNIPIHTVLNGVNAQQFSPPVTPPPASEIIFVGQMGDHKGADLAVSAVAALDRPVRLRMIGSSVHGATSELTGYERQLRQIAASAKPGVQITFEPFRPNADLPDVYRSAGIALLPSRFEDPCPLVCLEALASGCAVIGSSRGGIPEICADAAVIVEPVAEQITSALEKLLSEENACTALRKQARRRAESLSWDHQYAELRRFVESVRR